MIDLQRNPTELVPTLRAIASQLLKPPHTTLVARASRFDTFANPDFFLRQ
jgi:hypothetical protein